MEPCAACSLLVQGHTDSHVGSGAQSYLWVDGRNAEVGAEAMLCLQRLVVKSASIAKVRTRGVPG